MRYLLNSAVITSYGTWEYTPATVEEAVEFLQKPHVSTIGYQETADALKLITGVEVKVNRSQIQMQPGDVALVFRLTKRLSQPELKGMVGVKRVLENHEMGFLRRLR